MAAKRILKLEDMQSAEDYLEKRKHYTDEQARKLGYSNAEVLRLSDNLTRLAGKWRETKEDQVASQYRETLLMMILKGYDVDTLPIQDQLPTELMPEFPPQPVRKAIMQAYEEITSIE